MKGNILQGKGQAYLLLLATFFIWGSIYVASKYAMETMQTVTIAAGRYIVAFAVMVPLKRSHLRVKIDRADWKYLFIIGGLGYYLMTVVNIFGVQLAGASTAALINSLNPVSISIFAAIFLHERIGIRKIICILLSVLGALVISSGASGSGEIAGVLLSLLAIVLWGFASVSMRKLTTKYGAMTVTLYGIIISLLFYIPSAVADIALNGGFQCSLGSGLAVLYMGIFGTGVAGYFWTKALSLLEASVCSLFYPLQAMFSAILGALLLNEQFRPTFYIGTVIIAVSVIINCSAQLNREKIPRLPEE